MQTRGEGVLKSEHCGRPMWMVPWPTCTGRRRPCRTRSGGRRSGTATWTRTGIPGTRTSSGDWRSGDGSWWTRGRLKMYVGLVTVCSAPSVVSRCDCETSGWVCLNLAHFTRRIQYISVIVSVLGPGKIDTITNKALYQMLLWRGIWRGVGRADNW